MEKILEWIKEHKAKTISLGIIMFLAPLIIIHLLFKWYWGTDFFVAEWSAGELLGYVGAFFAFVGTVTLGILALWQNDKLSKQNETNRKMIENKDMPVLRALISHIDPSYNIINILLSNVSENVAKNIHLTNFDYRGISGGLLYTYNIHQRELYLLVKQDGEQRIKMDGTPGAGDRDINIDEIGIVLKLNYEDIYNRKHYCVFQQKEAKSGDMFLINEEIKND